MSVTTISTGKRGTLLGGKYRVERVLGRGGMGKVLLARHEGLDQLVAVKILGAEALRQPEQIVRLTREARAAAKLESEHAVRVTDVGTFDDVGPYVVMEYLRGVDLADLLAARGPLPVEEAVDYVLEAIDAVAEAHAKGIVHRDLKPSNLFLATRPDGSRLVKVVDFGIAKVFAPDDPTNDLTTTDSILGSPVYMPPEQLGSSRDIDARADIWALGVVLFELLSRELPFDQPSFGELVAAVAVEEPRALCDIRPDAPKALEAVLRRCMQRSPEERFRCAGELALALAPFGSGRCAKQIDRALTLGGFAPPAVSAPPVAVPRRGRANFVALALVVSATVVAVSALPRAPTVAAPPAPSLAPTHAGRPPATTDDIPPPMPIPVASGAAPASSTPPRPHPAPSRPSVLDRRH